MYSEAVKVAKIQAKSAKIQAEKDLMIELIHNPVVELLAGIVAISYLNKGSQSWLESVSGIDLAAGSEYAGLIAIIGLQQLAPLAPSIARGSEGLFKALPTMLALGAG